MSSQDSRQARGAQKLEPAEAGALVWPQLGQEVGGSCFGSGAASVIRWRSSRKASSIVRGLTGAEVDDERLR